VSGATATPFLPGATIGILGGGQLGRMSAIAARRMGFGVRVFDPEAGGPASQIADGEVAAAWGDATALERFASSVDVATIEFENIPAGAAAAVAALVPLHPGPAVLHTCQNRERERGFLASGGYPQPEFRIVGSAEELASALAELARPCVLKTVESGYDGKGQVKVGPGSDAAAVWKAWGGTRGIVEEWIAFELELSVVCARGPDGRTVSFPPRKTSTPIISWTCRLCPAGFPPPSRRKPG
jgi:5-(carboxyamino)imidazole ribonucleotide synthase